MHRQAIYALAHPVYDPETQITPQNFWAPDKRISAWLTVNIGME